MDTQDEESGMTALLLAAARGDQAGCRFLLQARADLEAADDDGSTCLHWVAYCMTYGAAGCAATLIQGRADVRPSEGWGGRSVRRPVR